jgi:hypothetical protein
MEKLNPDEVEQAIKNMPEVEQVVAKFLQGHHQLKKQLASANDKLEAIKNALPDYRVLESWGARAKAFVEKVYSIINTL